MRLAVSCARRASVGLALAVFLVLPGQAQEAVAIGSGTSLSALVGGVSSEFAATGPLEGADDARVASLASGSIPALGRAEALHATTLSSISAWTPLDEVYSRASLGKLDLTLAGHRITAEFAMAWASAPVGQESAGGTVLGDLRVDGHRIRQSGLPNQRFQIMGLTLILNELQRTEQGITASALRLVSGDDSVHVVVASATAGIVPPVSTTTEVGSTSPMAQ